MLSVCNALVLMAGPLNIRVARCRWVAMEVQGKMKQEQERKRLPGCFQQSLRTDLCTQSFFSSLVLGFLVFPPACTSQTSAAGAGAAMPTPAWAQGSDRQPVVAAKPVGTGTVARSGGRSQRRSLQNASQGSVVAACRFFGRPELFVPLRDT